MQAQTLSTIKLANSKDGVLSLALITEPYGKGSPSVISLASCLKPGQIDWKVHIPKQNLDELIVALEAIKNQLASQELS